MRFLPALVLALALPALADPAADSARRGIAAVEGLLKQRPEDPTLWFYLSRFQSEAGDTKASVAALEKVAALGEGFLPVREFGFAKVWDDPAFQAVVAKLAARLPRLDYAPTAFELEDRTLLPEGIAHDPGTGDFFVGSVSQRRILRVSPAGAVRELAGAGDGLDSVLGLAVDAPRRLLYAVSTNALTAAGEKAPRNAILRFDLETGRKLGSVAVPGAKQLNDVAIAPGGRVFATDSASGAVYEIPATGEAREAVAPGRMRGTNGIAASPDGRTLYLANSTGIAALDLASGELWRVAPPARETLAAIDGLYQWQGQLIGVQNVTTPGRVILVTLAPDRKSATRVQTLLSHHHTALDEPTTGVVTPQGFFLLAATAVSRFDREGRIERPDSLPRPTVLRIPLPR